MSRPVKFFPNSANHQHGYAVTLSVTDNPMGFGVIHGLAIDQKLIRVAAVRKLNGNMPGTIHLTLHWMGTGIPIIKFASDKNLACLLSQADKMNRLARGFGHHSLGGRWDRSVPVHFD